jgi:hypothetical protein
VANNALYTGSLSEKNVNNMARLYPGMDEFDVLQVMRRPYSEESFALGADEYKVWFYVTRVTGLGQSRMVAQNLTPFAFRNGILIGWGYDYYRWMLKKQAEQEDALEDQKNAAPLKVVPGDDKGIEQALKPVSMSKKPKEETPPPKKPPEKKKPPLKPEDEEMLHEESEQNFNFW